MQQNDKILEVRAIENGTVIDHIPADSLFKVINILDLNSMEEMITFGTNLDSKQHGKKAIIKLSGVFFKDSDINKIALVAPQAKLNVIRNFEVTEKKIVKVPDEVRKIVKCVNPKCITNHESVEQYFKVINKEKIQLRCHYCEKITDQEHMAIK